MRFVPFAFLLLSAMLAGCGKKSQPSAPEGNAQPQPAPSGDPPTPAAKGKGTFTIGKATTHVTGPKDATGHIDYVAAVNERLGKGITPAKNANVLLWKAIGPSGPEPVPAGYFEKLGIPAPPPNGTYYMNILRYAQQNPGTLAPDTAFDTLNRHTRKPWKADENKALAAWLTGNEKPLELIVEATGRDQYYNPLIPPSRTAGLLNAVLPGTQAAREFAAVLVARAMVYAGHGQNDAAWADLLACHRLARLVGRGGALLEGLVGIAIDQIASRADLAFLEHSRPDAKKIEGYLRDLAALPPMPGVAEKVDVTERFMFLDHVMQLDRQGLAYLTGLPGGGDEAADRIDAGVLSGVNWDPALEAANKWFDRLTAAVREPDRAERNKKFDQLQADMGALKLDATGQARVQQLINEGKDAAKAKGQAVGEILLRLGLPAVWKVQDAADRAAQVFENVRTAFALELYRRENGGRYPNDLAPLAKHLGRAPSDLFSGNAPVYRPGPNGYLLYSVGPNGKDDGGRTAEEKSGGDDLAVRIPAAGK